MKNFKSDFPIFKNNPNLVYLDNAATSQKPQSVIDAVRHFYEHTNANIHRGLYTLSQIATEEYENTRKKVASFIGAEDASEIIFTKNTSESINLVAYGWAKKQLKAGDIVIVSEMEHHSNIVPWLRLKEEKEIQVYFLPINTSLQSHGMLPDNDGIASFLKKMDIAKIKLVALTHVSNVLGTINPIKAIITYFKKLNKQTRFLIDAAQSVAHLDTNIHALDCDFLVFSSHKMFGPTGVGILWAKKELLENMNPLLVGSHMIQRVTQQKAMYAQAPDKFETGTANIEGVIGLGAAIDYINSVGRSEIKQIEVRLTQYTLDMLTRQSGVILFGPRESEHRIGVFAFNVGNIHAHDIAEICNRLGVAVRAGHHCAQPLMDRLQVTGTARASLSFYNTKQDIDKLIEGIELAKRTFKR